MISQVIDAKDSEGMHKVFWCEFFWEQLLNEKAFHATFFGSEKDLERKIVRVREKDRTSV